MKQSTLTVPAAPVLNVTRVGGDLQVVGWERPEITAKADGEALTLVSDGQQAEARSDSNLILYVPRQTGLRVVSVGGDVDLRAVTGALDLESVGGDLQIRNVGAVRLAALGGDLSVRGCAGDFLAEKVGGDVSLHQIEGNVRLQAGADLYLREAGGNVSAQVGADAALYLFPKAGQMVMVEAGGDILLRLPARMDVEFSLQGCDDESIRVDLPGQTPVELGLFRQFTVGSGAAKISLLAGSEVTVTSRDEEWASVAEFDPLGREGPFSPGEFPGISPDLQDKISRRMEEATRRALQASVRAQDHSERIQQRVDVAMRRAEEKLRSTERRSAHMGISTGRWGMTIPPRPPIPPGPPAPPAEPVSDVERLTVLKMLQEKKISLAEAEKLLAALEGK
jgi:hypothetical protein